MFDKKTEELYNPNELLQENWIDFDIMREKPLVFRSGDSHLVVKPLLNRDTPLFLKDLFKILGRYYAFFQEVEFLTAENYKNKSQISQAVNSITFFNSTDGFSDLVRKDIPAFIRRWGFTVKRERTFMQKLLGSEGNFRFVKISRRKAKRILSDYTTDELLQVFFSIVVFNYDIVKKKTMEFLQMFRNSDSLMNPTTFSTSTGKHGNQFQFPEYSEKPFSEATWKQLEQLNFQNIRKN